MKGGRPVGARDKITNQMIRLAEETAAEYGEEMFRRLAKDDPAACLALITRLLPNSDLSKAIEGESEGGSEITQVNISITPAPSQRLPDSRSQQQIDDRQRGLISRVQPSEDDLRDVIEEAVAAPTVDTRDEEAARAERERVRRQNDAIRAHGGLTGRAPRSAAPDTLDYRDDEDWL